MTFSDMANDIVCLIKPTGKRIENIKASVQSKMIFVFDDTVPIEEGDVFERVRPKTGIVERYEVLDAGFIQTRGGGIKSHYQCKIKKIINGNKPATMLPPSDDSKIFLVHGHDEEMKQTVARTISDLGLQPIILHEQVNCGKTIIEKFESNSDVGFAIVLLSPDDMVFSSGKDHSTAQPHARQNVILELGYFAGKIGRDRVFALKRGDTVVPSDFSGVVYTNYDAAGAWRLSLAKELRAADYKVDANKL